MTTAAHAPNGIRPIFAYADAAHRKPFDIAPLLFEGANTIRIRDAVAKAYGIIEKTYGAIYHRVRRLLKRLEKEGIVYSARSLIAQGWGETPSVWWRLTIAATNLIKQVQNSNSVQMRDGLTNLRGKWGWANFPNRANPERITACKLLRNIKPRRDHWLWQRESKTSPVRPELQKLQRCVAKPYNRYITYVKQTAIALCPREMADKLDESELQIIPYKTRFTAIDRQLNNLDRYSELWAESKEYYKEAVFLTLTTDPAQHDTLWHANRHFQVAWNRYLSLLTKRNKKAAKKAGTYDSEENYRPRYICVYEFQQNMLLHCHAIIFGIDKIDKDWQISEDWDRCGQGRITKQIPLVLKNDQWGWKNGRPADAKADESPEKYLKKYLNKAIAGHQDFELYWAFNKRFMSSSRSLAPWSQPRAPPKPKPEPAGTLTDRETKEEIPYYDELPPKPQKLSPMVYVGTITGGIFPDWLLQKLRVKTIFRKDDEPLPKIKREWCRMPPDDERPPQHSQPRPTDAAPGHDQKERDEYAELLRREREERRRRREERKRKRELYLMGKTEREGNT